MKLVSAHDGTHRPNGTARAQAGLTVSKMQLALGEARGVSEQTGHLVARAVRILDALAQHHVAAALAVYRPRLREAREPVPEALRGRECTGMEFGIAAGQPADVAAFWRRLIGERRKSRDLRARFAPAREHMRIDERKRRVRRQRDTLAGGRQRANSTRRDRFDRSRASDDGVEIEISFRHVREAIEARSQVAILARLDKAEVA